MPLQFSAKQFHLIGQQHYCHQVMRLLGCSSSTPEDDVLIKDTIWSQALLAQSHGLMDERSITVFVLCAWLLGVGFDEHIPVIHQILHSTELHNHEKTQALEHFTLLVCSIFDSNTLTTSEG